MGKNGVGEVWIGWFLVGMEEVRMGGGVDG
jgi:hypothetical protein